MLPQTLGYDKFLPSCVIIYFNGNLKASIKRVARLMYLMKVRLLQLSGSQ
jgi:hypothetical protein